jgi:hypothetical protein
MDLLDDRGFAENGVPLPKRLPPSPPLVVRRRLGIGPDWIGTGSANRWRYI